MRGFGSYQNENGGSSALSVSTSNSSFSCIMRINHSCACLAVRRPYEGDRARERISGESVIAISQGLTEED